MKKRLSLLVCILACCLSRTMGAVAPTCGPPTIITTEDGVFPASTSSDVVLIQHKIIIGDGTTDAMCVQVAVGGSLDLSGGHLSTQTLIGDAGSTIKGQGTWELSFKDAVPTDAEKKMVGLIGQGTIDLQGEPMAFTFSRLAAAIQVGDSTFTTEDATGWKVGDRLWFPWTQQPKDAEKFGNFIDRSEYKTILSINEKSVTVATPFAFPHRGVNDALGQLYRLPHVANLSRTAVIRSESTVNRGHIIYQGSPSVTMKYVNIQYSGRTTSFPLTVDNLKGSYGVHFHMTGDSFPVFVGNSIEHTLKWAIALHMTHHGLVQYNVVVDAGGAGIVTEDGSESFNVIDRNFVGQVYGRGGRQQYGREGMCYWFRGPNNSITNNVAANCRSLDSPEASYGFEIFLEQLNAITYPGATNVVPQKLPVRQFENNEVYFSYAGLSFWWIGIRDTVPQNAPLTTFKNSSLWGVAEKCVYAYQQANVLYDGLTCIGDRTVYTTSIAQQYGWFPSDYTQHNVELRDARIENMKVGIWLPRKMIGGKFTVTNPILRNGVQNIMHRQPWSVAADARSVGQRNIYIVNPTYGAVSGTTPTNFSLGCGVCTGCNLTARDRLYLNNDPVFTTCQRSAYVVPTTIISQYNLPSTVGQDPPGGLTNAQLFDAGKAVYGGEIATCETAPSSSVLSSGYLCPIPPTPVPPVNDAFTAAIDLVGDTSETPVQGTTVNATSQIGEPIGAQTVWYRWVPVTSGNGTLVLSGPSHIMEVYVGSTVTGLTLVGQSDVANYTVVAGLAEGVAHYVRVRPRSVPGPFSFSYQVNTEPPPPPPPPVVSKAIAVGVVQ